MTRRSVLKEPVLILGTWCCFCAWVVGYCAWHYLPTEIQETTVADALPAQDSGSSDAQALHASAPTDEGGRSRETTGASLDAANANSATPLVLIFGLPAWVFWGVGLPWILATLYTIYFASKVMDEEAFHA